MKDFLKIFFGIIGVAILFLIITGHGAAAGNIVDVIVGFFVTIGNGLSQFATSLTSFMAIGQHLNGFVTSFIG